MYARCPRNLFGFINGGVIIKGTLRGEDEEGRLILDDQHEAATGIMPRMLGADHLKLPAMEQYARTCDWLAEVTERSSAIELDIIDPAITCDSCGACCQHMGYPPTSAIMDPEEWMALPDALRIEIHDAMHALRGDQELPCIWLDEQTKQCKHYEYRPSICRDFPVGGESCIRMRKDRV